MQKQIKQASQLEELKEQEQKLVEQREKQPYKIEVKNMPENERYTAFDLEGKLFKNIIKMICNRAETVICLLLNSEIYTKHKEIH